VTEADDPTRQRPIDSGGAEAQTAEWAPPEVEAAHGDAIAAAAADKVHEREADTAQQEADAARDELEKLSRKERKAREKAEKERAKSEAERAKADEAIKREQEEALARAAEADARAATADPAVAAGVHQPQPARPYEPPVEPVTTASDDKPEVMVGAAFAGAFLFAKLLKRITNR
jgi:hypothetical protein